MIQSARVVIATSRNREFAGGAISYRPVRSPAAARETMARRAASSERRVAPHRPEAMETSRRMPTVGR
ncbi:hypothetical protein [Methylobacterium sp. Leaf399]|uniref:hypothetical protein n=1 Tax=Methylobacterium sp. Leaf399 TaxID=1736364 RepID=UPI000B2D1A51|nr:hypothetical protein [Methylobacterium sp. Leaf399]